MKSIELLVRYHTLTLINIRVIFCNQISFIKVTIKNKTGSERTILLIYVNVGQDQCDQMLK